MIQKIKKKMVCEYLVWPVGPRCTSAAAAFELQPPGERLRLLRPHGFDAQTPQRIGAAWSCGILSRENRDPFLELPDLTIRIEELKSFGNVRELDDRAAEQKIDELLILQGEGSGQRSRLG